jgi:hypothetical protein
MNPHRNRKPYALSFDFLNGNYSTHSIPDFGLIESLWNLLPNAQVKIMKSKVFANQIKEKDKT